MSACCMGFASNGEHDKSCAVGRHASEAAPEPSGSPAVKPKLTDDQKKAWETEKAKITALIQAAQIAARNARGDQ